MRADIRHLERTRDGRRVVRVRSQLWMMRGIFAFFVLLYGGGVVLATDLDRTDRLVYSALLLIQGLAWLVIVERMAVELHRDGFVVRGGLRLRGRRVRWRDVERFEIHARGTRGQQAVAVLSDGRRVRLPSTAAGLNVELFPRQRATQDCVAILEHELALARGTASPATADALPRTEPQVPPTRPSRRANPTDVRLAAAAIAPALVTTLGSLIGDGKDDPVTGWSGTIAILSIPAWAILFNTRNRRRRTWAILAVLALGGATAGLALQTAI